MQSAIGNRQSVICIIGLGTPLRGDDGVGPRVIRELAGRPLPPGVETLDAGLAGLDLLNWIEQWTRVVVVDAADVGRQPGQFVRFTLDEARLVGTDERLSFHHASLAEVVALARALGQPLPPIVVFGVQPERMGWGEGLSPTVEAALPALIQAILREVGEDNVQNSDR